MNKKIISSLLVIGALFLTGCTADRSGNVDESNTDTIKIGYVGPLTGGAAAYGQDVKSGVELYFKENPTINGKKVEVIYEDGKCNGQDAANAAQKLINVDKVEVILGGQCSGESMAIAPIVAQTGKVMLSSLSSSPELTSAGPHFFRNYPSDDKVTETLVEDLLANNYQKIAILAEQTDFSQGYKEAIKKHLKNKNAEDRLVMEESYAVDNTDFRTLLTKAKEKEVDAIVSVGQTPVTNGFTVKQAKELGVDAQIYGPDTIDGKDFFDTAKDASEGVKQVVVAEDPSRNGYPEFAEKVKDISQYAPLFIAFGYDGAAIVSQAIAEEGYSADAIKAYLSNMGTYKGLASDVTFDENGDNQVPAAVKRAKAGKFEVISN